MPDVVVGLGANLGSPRRALAEAVRQLEDRYGAVQVASLYRSAPVGGPPQPPYLNSAVRLAPAGDGPLAILDACLAIEAAGGRTRSGLAHEPRTLDLDLWWYGGQTLDTPRLVLPHPRAHQRRFVLLPWRELMPHAVLHGRPLDAWLDEVRGQPICRLEGPEWPQTP